MIPATVRLETATLGGGCFWCVEAVLEQLKGVYSVVSGYSGGTTVNPTYRDDCDGDTGHAEVVQVHFDPNVVSYADILSVFFATHDPTTLNRQGADVGTQYRSVIFYNSPAQKAVAEEVIADLNRQGIWSRPIVTQVVPAAPFYRAEGYHLGYFRANPMQPYCQAVIEPKVTKFRQKFADKLKS
jgi:peptide-methionine (S)-S-oxide reductase